MISSELFHINNIVNKGILSYTLNIPALWKVIAWSFAQHAVTICMPFFLIFVMSKIWFVDNILSYVQLAFVFVFISSLLLSTTYIKDYIFNQLAVKYNDEISTESLRLLLSLAYQYIGLLPVESQFSRYAPLRNFVDIWFNEIVKPLLDLPLVIMVFSILCYLMGFAYFTFLVSILLVVIFVNRYLYTNKISDQSVTDAVFHGTISDAFNNIDIIKKHNKINVFNDKIQELIEKKVGGQFSTSVRNGLRDNIIDALLMFLYVGSLVFAVYYVLNEMLAVQNLIIIVILIWFSISPCKTIIEAIYRIPKLQELIRQYTILKNVNLKVNRHKKVKLKDNFKGDVVLKSVGFNLSSINSGFMLNNISFNAKRGEVMLITGPSGSGKSTILKLISGLYAQSYGVIAIDIDKSIIDEQNLAEKVIYIGSDSYLDNESVINNIRLTHEYLDNDSVINRVLEFNVDQHVTKAHAYKSIRELKNIFKDSTESQALIDKLIMSKITHETKGKVLLIDEPFIENTHGNFEAFVNLINEIKPYNTILICSRYNFYAPLADVVLILGDGQIKKYFRKNNG